MPSRAFVFAAVIVVASASTSFAQAKAPIGRFVVDLRGASAGLPTDEGWTPVVPVGTQAPSRALGLEIGGHVQVLRFGSGALGVGGTWLVAKGTFTPPQTAGTAPSVSGALPTMTTRLTSLSPQLSLNFGHALGWSYLSAGLGRTTVESDAQSTSTSIVFTPRDSGSVKTLNFGGGARWFINEHLGVGFDLRWYKLSIVPASQTHPGAPRASLVTAAVGIAVK
jgi:hypothetical protein